MDLMFSDARDPPAVIAARKLEMAHVASWIAAADKGSRGKDVPVVVSGVQLQ
jgi:hypothetical protein